MDNLRESAWLLSKLQGATVSIRHIWQAHSDAITSVIRIAHPPAIFSTSADRLATMWKYDGSECYGSLRRGGPLKGDALACFHQARAKAMSSKHNSAGVPTSFIMGALCPETAGRAAASAPCAALVPEPADGDARRDDGGSGGSTPNERRPPAAHIPGLVRAKGRRAQRGTEWCFPADNAIPHQVITSSAEAILAQVDLHGVQSKIKAEAHGDVRSHGVADSTKYFMPAVIAAQHKVRVTEEPSRAAINGAATINSVQSSSQLAYLPLTSAQLCHSVWSQSRSPDGLLGQQVLLSRPGTAHKSDQFVGCLPNGANQRSSAVDVMVRELKALLMGQRSRVMDLFLSMDANADGMITIHELQDALAELQIYAKPATIQALFNSLDHDGNGTIEYPELFKVLGRRDQPNDQGLSKGHVHSKASPQVPAIRSMLQSRNSAGKASRTAKLADGSDVHSTSAYPHLRYLCDFCEGDSDERSIKTTVRFHLPGKDVDCCAKCHAHQVPEREQASFVRVYVTKGRPAAMAGAAVIAAEEGSHNKGSSDMNFASTMPAPFAGGANRLSSASATAHLSLTAPQLDASSTGNGLEIVRESDNASPQRMPTDAHTERLRHSQGATEKMASSTAAERLDSLLAADSVASQM